MESPKFDWRGFQETKELLWQIGENMKKQVGKPSIFDELETKRGELLHDNDVIEPSNIHDNKKRYKNNEELDKELSIFRDKLQRLSVDPSEDLRESYTQRPVGRSLETLKAKKIEILEDLNKSKHKITVIDEFRGFNEMKYQTEIKLLRQELDKLRKSKGFLEKELTEIKGLMRPKRDKETHRGNRRPKN